MGLTRNLKPLLALVPAATVMAMGCGRSEADAVRDATRAYLSALSDGDYRAACQHLAAAAQRDIATYVRTALPDLGTTRCPGVLHQALRLSDARALAALRDVEIEKVTVSRDNASVTLEGRPQTVALARDAGAWKIATLEFPDADRGS